MKNLKKLIIWKFTMVFTVLTNSAFLFKPNISAIFCAPEGSSLLQNSDGEIIKEATPTFFIFDSKGKLYTYDQFFNRLMPFDEPYKNKNISVKINESIIKDSKLLIDMSVRNTEINSFFSNYKFKIDLTDKVMHFFDEGEWLKAGNCKNIELPKGLGPPKK